MAKKKTSGLKVIEYKPSAAKQASDRIEQEAARKKKEEEQARYAAAMAQQGITNQSSAAERRIADEMLRTRQAAQPELRQQEMTRAMKSAGKQGEGFTTQKLYNFQNDALNQILTGLDKRMENESTIINKQGRAEDDPARLRAEDEYAKLLAEREKKQNQLANLTKPQQLLMPNDQISLDGGRIAYSAEEEQEIRKIQGKIEKGMSRFKDIPYVYEPQEKEDIHNLNAAAVKTEEDYVKWLRQGANAGLYAPEEAKKYREYAYYKLMPDSRNTREYSTYIHNGIEQGMFDDGSDISLMSTRKLKDDIEAMKTRRDTQEENDQNKDALESELYDIGQRKGVYDELARDGLLDPLTQERHKGRPADYDEWGRRGTWKEDQELAYYYDSLLYDKVHGEGAYNDVFENGTDEDFDRMDDEIQEMWRRMDDGTIGEMGGETLGDREAELRDITTSTAGDIDRQIALREEELRRRSERSEYEHSTDGADYALELDEGVFDRSVEGLVDRTRNSRTGFDLWEYNESPEATYVLVNRAAMTEADTPINENVITQGANLAQAEKAYRKYAHMTEDMLRTFNGLYQSGDKEKAMAYLKTLDPYLNAMQAEYVQGFRERAAAGGLGALYGAETVLTQPVAGIKGTVGTVLSLLGNKDAQDKYSDFYKEARRNQQIRGARAGAWGDFFANTFGEKYREAGEWLNGVTYSIADNLMAMTVAKAGGAVFNYDMASDTATKIVQVVMSSEATASEMAEALEKGMDPTEAAIRSIGSGMIEAITEKYSIEALLKPNVREMLGDWKQVGKFLLKNTVAEGAEEGASDILGTVWDEMLSSFYSHESELTAEYNALVAQGMDKTEASRQVWNNWLAKTGSDIAAGALSGFIMSTGRVAQNTWNQMREGRNIRSGNNSEGAKTGADQLIEAARGMDEKSVSRQMAEDMFEARQKGKKVSARDVGRLAQNMAEESNEQVAQIAEDTVDRIVREELKGKGVTVEIVDKVAPIITKAAITDSTAGITKGEQAALAQDRRVIDTFKEIMSDSGRSVTGAVISQQAAQPLSVRETVNSLLNGNTVAGLNNTIGRDVAKSAAKIAGNLASAEEIKAAKGRTTNSGLDAIVGDNLVQVIGLKDGKIQLKTEDGTQTAEIGEAVAAGEQLGTVLEYINRTGLIDDTAASAMITGIRNNQKLSGAKYMADAMNVYMAARTGGVFDSAALNKETVEAIRKAAQQENARVTEEALKKGKAQQNVPGEGGAVYDGAEFGTEAWDEKMKGLSNVQRQQANVLAEMMRLSGTKLELINDEKNDGVFGWEEDSGKITINLAARDTKTSAMNRNLLNTAGHEMTHWLKQNSREGYDQLQAFIFDRLRNGGADIAALVMNKVDQYRSIKGQENINIDGAMDEIVADACDQVLTNAQLAKEIQAEYKGLAGKIRKFAQGFIDRWNKAVRATSSSATSRELMKQGQEVMDRIAEIWNIARKEAMNRNAGTAVKAEAKPEAQQMSVREDNNIQTVNNPGVETIDPEMIVPVNEIKDTVKYNILAEEFATNGYNGNPVLVIRNENGEMTALTGSHRIYAARKAGINIPAYVIDINDDIRELTEAYDDDEKLRVAEDLLKDGKISEEPVKILRDEINNWTPEGQFEANRRYSVRDEGDMDVQNWMMTIRPENLRTEQERNMLKQYQNTRVAADLARMSVSETRKKIQALEKKMAEKGRNVADAEQLRRLNNKYDEAMKRLDQQQERLVKITTDEGYAALMYREHENMDRLVNGRTVKQVQQSVEALTAAVQRSQKVIEQREQKIKAMADTEAVKQIQALLSGGKLDQMAAWLRKTYNSSMNKQELMAEMSAIRLKMATGADVTADAEALAWKLLYGIHYTQDPVLAAMRGITLELGAKQVKEIYGNDMTMKELRSRLAGTGIKVKQAEKSGLDADWTELRKMVPELSESTNELDQVNEILQLVENRRERAMMYGVEKYGANIQDVTNDVLAATAAVNMSQPKDPQAMAVLKKMNTLIRKMAGTMTESTEALAEARAQMGELVQHGKLASDMSKAMQKNVEDAIRYNNALVEQSEAVTWAGERLKLVNQMRDKHTQDMLAQQEKWREKIAKDKTAREMEKDNMQIRRKIHTNIMRIRSLLMNENDQRHIPEHMKSLAREVLRQVVRSDLIAQKITGMGKQYLMETARLLDAWNEQDGRFDISDLKMIEDEEAQAVVANALADLEEGIAEYNGDTRGKDIIENMTMFKKALEKIADSVAKIKSIIDAENRISLVDREISVTDAAMDIMNAFPAFGGKGELQGRGAKAVNAVKRGVVYGNETPVYFFKNLKNKGIDALWNGMQYAENRNGLLMQEAKAFMDKLAEDTKYADWDHEKKYTVKLNGVPVQMTIEQMMAVYVTWQREQEIGPENSMHMAHGGIYLQDEDQDEGRLHREKKQQRAQRVKQADIEEIEKLFTKDQKKYMDAVVKYLSNNMSDLGNEASMRMYGIKKYKEKYYFPMKVWDGVKSARSDKGISGTDDNRIAHQGWSKRRRNNAQNALVIGNFTDTAVKHISEMINYATFAPEIENLNKVLNWQYIENELEENPNFDEENPGKEVKKINYENRRNIRVLFQENYGKEALRYLEEFMKDLQGGAVQDQRKTLRDRALAIFKKNAVAGSLSVAAQQPLSYIRAAMMVNPKYLAEALVPGVGKDAYKERMKYSGVSVIKEMGRFDMNFGQSARDFITPEQNTKGVKAALGKAAEATTVLPEIMDRVTWNRMWTAVKLEQMAQNPDADHNSKEFLSKVGERFNDVMRKTQVYDSTLVKSSNMRSQNLSMKILTSFMAEPTLTLNVLADAVRNVNTKGGKIYLARAGATFMMSAVLQAFVKGLIGSGRTPDEKKTWVENFLYKWQQNLQSEVNVLGLIPGYSDLIELLKNGELKDDAMGALGKIKGIITTAQNAFDPEKSKGAWRDIEDSAGQLAQLFTNVPVKNLMRDARAIYNWVSGSTYASRETSSAVLREQAKAAALNGDNLLGVLNGYLGEAGYQTTNKAYYGRLFDAMQSGNEGAEADIREYMELAKGADDKAIASGLRTAAKDRLETADALNWMMDNDLLDSTSTVTTAYKEGKITAQEATKLYKQAELDQISEKQKAGKLNAEEAAEARKNVDNDVWWKIDRMNWQKETGAADTPTGNYYRLTDAVNANRAADIQKAVNDLLKHGVSKEKIKDKLSDWKSEYIAADNAGKIRIRDAITKAYKAAGYTAKDADKTIKRWNEDAKKGKN